MEEKNQISRLVLVVTVQVLVIRFRIQFGVNLNERVFQKADIAQASSTSQFQLFEKLTCAN